MMVGYQKAEVQLSSYQLITAGAVAGIISRFTSQPLDVLKVRFQLQIEPLQTSSTSSKYRSLLQAFQLIWKEEGVRAFWSGHNSGQLLSLIYSATNFGVFEALTKIVGHNFNVTRNTSIDFVCGMASGSAAVVASHPFDVLRTRFIAQGTGIVSSHSYKSMLGGLIKMINVEGIAAPYKGLLPALLQGPPLIGVSFATYGCVKSLIEKYDYLSQGADSLKFSGSMIAGGSAGFVSKTVIYPLDLTRRRMEFQGFQHARVGYGQNFTCNGLLNCLKRTLTTEGPSGLYKGFLPSAIKTTLSTSIQFTIYEELCRYLRKL